MSNESYKLAEDFVVEQIHNEIDSEWAEVGPGSTVTVHDMHYCDCIPVIVRDRHGNRWDLDGVLRHLPTRLTATYEATR